MMNQRPPPLTDLTVLDLGQVYLGPYAGLLLAKAGANVIKIEPLRGEPLRARGPESGGTALPLAMLNSNKRAITLNLKSTRGIEILKALVRKADVLLENFAPGVMDKLGVGANALMQENPRLVYASATGYGLSGPERDNLAMDITIQAASGAISITGFPDGPPVKAGPAIADFLSGTHLYAAIVTALYDRERTGRGRLVEVAMIETMFPTMASNLGMMHNNPNARAGRTGNRHGGMAVSPYNVYPCLDGWFAIICNNDDHWIRLAKAMGREELTQDPRFATNAARVAHMEETDAVVQNWASTLARAEILAKTGAHGVACAPVRDLREVLENAHMKERGMLEVIDHPQLGKITVPGSPLRYHGTPQTRATPSPSLGANNEDVLAELLGFDTAAVAALTADGVI
jgi:crotonobetainyl-CoA:carnitine CoA-transferase CaiB-like acyl-CoA transferase